LGDVQHDDNFQATDSAGGLADEQVCAGQRENDFLFTPSQQPEARIALSGPEQARNSVEEVR